MTSGKRKRSAILHRLTVDTAMPNSIRPQHHAGAVSDEAPFLASTFRGDGGGLMDVGPFRVGTDGIGFLEFGMVLSLMANDRSGVMASEGFTACDVRLERTLSPALFDDQKQHDGQLVGCHFKDCLFEVLPKMNYDATLAFEKAQLTKKDGLSGFSNPLSEMRFKSESEKRLNATAYSHSHGKHVNYGQGIQLRHIKSGKFLSTTPSSYDTSDSLDICLTSGSSASHFVLLPRFKLRRKGEPVQIQDQIMLATDDTRLFVQTSLNRFDQTALSSRLLTASVAHTSMIQWRLLPYDSSDAVQSTAETYRHKAGHGGFHAGQCLRLCHLETGSWLAYDSASSSLRLDGCGATDHTSSAMGVLSPDTLWEVECSRVFEGGGIHWTKRVCIRHVTTGKYLALNDNTTTNMMAVAQRTPQMFTFRPMTHVNIRSVVAHDSVVQIQHVDSAAFLHAAANTPNILQLSSEGSAASSMLSCPVEGISCPNDEDAFKLVSVPQVEVHDVMLLTSYRRMLKRFVQFFDATTSPIVQVCTSTETFLLDVLAAVDAMKSFAFQDTTQDPRRQSLLRKHQYMELVTRMLEAPFDPWGGPFTMAYVSLFRPDSRPAYDPMQSNISMTLVELDDGSDEASHDSISTPPPGRFCLSETCMTTIFQIVRASNMLLFRMFSSCKPSDALSCGRALSVLMKMLGHGFKASFPLSYLIQEKFHLSGEFKSFSKIIRDFLDLIQRQGKSYRYVQFLVVLCTANGLAVPKVQEKICDLIFVPSEGYKDAILIQTRPTHTNTFEVCLPTRRGNEWKPLKDFYDEYYKSNLHTTLAPYFYGLLQLYVALCMDRNYKCIEILKDKFPRKCLLACVQDVKLARSIRAVLMNLLLVIHIDCDPQTVVASPNYTRIWKDTAMTMIQIPQVDTTKYALEDREFFRQVKDLLMDYIATRKGVIVVGVGELARNELTLAMLRTCQKLVEFGMFHSDLQELVGHLVDLLDCRTDTILLKHQDDDGTSQPVEYAVPLFENSVQRTKNPFSRQYSDAYPSLPYRPMKRLSYMGTKPRGAHQPCQTTVSRFKASEGNTIVMEIKDCICATLLRVDALRLDYQLSLVLSYVKERNRLGSMVASDLSPLAQALAQRTFHLTCEYSLQTLANHRRLDTILLQTLMYEHPLLVSKALELLYRQFNQHEQLIKALDHVFLLVNDNTVHVYAKLQADVNQLRHLAETTEVWMDLTSSGDFDAAARACVLLKSLNGLMQSTDDMTRLISNLDVLTYVMAMIYSGSHYFHELFPSKSTVSPTSPQKAAATSSLVHDVLQNQQRGAIRNVYDGCMEFLLAYCTTNVQAVAEFAMTLVEFVEALPSAQHVLLAIYSNDLCDAIPHDVLVQFVRWSVYYKHRSNDARYLTFLKDVAVSSTSTQQALLMQCMKNPMLVDTQDVSDQTYAAEIFHLLTTVATTTQARDICAESIVTVNRWVDLFDQFQPTDFSNHPTETSDSFGVAAMKYLQLVLLPHEDCIYKMDDTLHVRLFDCVRKFSLFAIRCYLTGLMQLDLREDKARQQQPVSRDDPVITQALIPTLLAYFPKLNPALLVSAHLDMNEWMAAWFAYVFCSVSHTTVADASAGGSLHLCMRWLDQLWKSDLEALLVESCQRSSRPFLGIGLGGMRTSEPFLVDFAKPFGDILSDLQAYRAYCQAKTTDHHPSASLVSSLPPLAAIETPIKPLETGHDMIPALQTVPKQHKWLFGRWGRSNNNHKSAVLPSDPSPSAAARKLPSPRHYNMPNFGAYAEDDSSIVQDYLKYIRDHRLTKNAIRNELSAMMQSILCLEDALKEENVTNSGAPAVISTFDDVAAKLVSHFKMLKQPKYVKMRLVLLDVFTRTILSLETESKRRRMQLKLDQLGLTDVIVDLISHSDDFTVFDKCVWLGIAMLDGMNARVQEKFHVLITQQHEHSAEFLGKFKLHLDMLFAHPHTDHSNHVEPKSGLLLSQIMYFSPKTRSDLSEPTSKYQSASRQFRFLQLLCEGHYLRNQMCMLGQGNNASSCVNVVEMATLVVVEFHSNVSWDAMALLRQVMDTITEFCQGPCPEAQMCVANYKFISAVNELLWRDSTTLTITAVELLRQLKASIVITLLSLLERRTDHEIHRRLVQELNLEAIKANLIVVHEYFHHKYHGNYDGNEACSRDAFLSMGFNLHILMQQLMEFQPSLISLLYPMDDVAYRHAYDFFDDRCARVEIVWPQTNVDHHHHASTTSNNHGDLISMYFPLHPICVCLTDRTKRRLQSEVSRDANKLNDFYDKTHDVIVEMQHQCTLRQYAWMAFLTRHLSRLKMAAFAWSLVLNALIVLYNHIDRQQVESPPPWIVQSAGYVHVALCLAMVTGHCINDVPLLFQQATTPSRTHVVSAYKQSNLSADNSSTLRFDSTVNETFQDVEDKVRAIGDPRMTRQHHRPPRWARVVWFVLWVVVWDAKTMYHLGLVGLSIGGAFFHQPLCFSFHVLDIVNRSSELRYVSKAIVYPGRSLLHILVLYLLSAYVFGFVGLVYFAKYFDKDDYNGCDTLWVCFLTSLDEGLKNNGGIGGFLAPSHRDTGDPLAYPRLAYDLLYYVGLIIILTNLAFGLIIDTFATLRTQHKENQDDLKDRCFICSIDCFTFNRMTKGFDHHTRHEHNIWHYIYLFVHLRKKHFTHYNGVELYLATRMAKRDVTFFPSHRALALEKLHDRNRPLDDTPSSSCSSTSTTTSMPHQARPHVPGTACQDVVGNGGGRASRRGSSITTSTTGTGGSRDVGSLGAALSPLDPHLEARSTADQLTDLVQDLHAQQQEMLGLLHTVVLTQQQHIEARTPTNQQPHDRACHRRAKSTSPFKTGQERYVM